MKNDKKKRGFEGITPVGTFQFPWLQRPDTKHNKQKMYQVRLLLTPEDAKPLVESLEKEFKKNLEFQAVLNDVEKIQASDKPWKKETDKKTDEETRMIEFNFKANTKR